MDKRKPSNEINEKTKQSEERLLALMKATSDIIYRMSPDWKTMTELYGRGFLADTERPNPEWLDKYIHPDDQPFVTEAIKNCIEEKKVFELEHRVLRADGNIGWTHSRAIPLLDEEGQIKEWFGAAGDITERKHAEEAKERLSALMDHNPSMVFLKDEEGRYVYLNKAYETQFFPSGNWYGKTDFDFWPKKSAELFWTNDASVLNSGQTMQFMEDSTDMEGKRYCWFIYKFPFTDSKNRKHVGGIGIDATRLVRTEEALKESETKYRELVEHSPAWILEIDFRTERFTSVNDAMCLSSGYGREDLLGMSPLDILDEESGKRYRQSVDQWLSGGKPDNTVECAVITKGCKKVFALLNVNLIQDIEGHPIGASVVAHDITERKKAGEELAYQARILDEVYDAIIATDMDFLITNWNKAAQRIYGWTAEEALGKNADLLFATEFSDVSKEEMTSRLMQQQSVEIEVVHTRKDGSRHNTLAKVSLVCDNNGIPSGTVGVLRDITDRKRAEETLREQDSILRLINRVYENAMAFGTMEDLGSACLEIVQSVTQSPISFVGEIGGDGFLHDIAISETGWAECAMCDQTGHRRPPGSFLMRGLYSSVLKSGKSLLTNDPSAHPKSGGLPEGHPRLSSFLGVPFLRDGKVIGMIAVANREGGYTEKERKLLETLTPTVLEVLLRKRAEEAQRESEGKSLALVTELEKADENKNRFISVLSHELRNPLAAISAGVQLLDLTQDKNQAEKAKVIMKRQTNQLCKLVDDLLELTRISQNKIKLKKENINLNEMIKGAVEDARPEYEKKGIQLGAKIQTKPVFLNADPVRITQIIGNILYNALKFTHANGTVWLTLKTEKNHAVISVKDNGIGISPELLQDLFTPFTQADNTLDRSGGGGGLGLGLSIVKGIVDLHEGNVSAYSEGLGKGSNFIIRLPIATGDQSVKEKQASGTAKKAFNILIIEDNRDFAELLSSLFKLKGHEISIALDGAEGIALAKQQIPDVIFCDIGLPGINGYEAARQIRENSDLKNVYLVALTGYAGEFDAELAENSRFDKHLAKPVDLSTLEKTLDEVKTRAGNPEQEN